MYLDLSKRPIILNGGSSTERTHISSTDLVRSGNIIFQINLVTQIHFGSADLKIEQTRSIKREKVIQKKENLATEKLNNRQL
jgi:hypothetical protein